MKHFYKKCTFTKSLLKTLQTNLENLYSILQNQKKKKKKRLYISLRNEGKLMLQMDLKFLKPCSATDIY